ncbi:MAG: glucose-1-phosphate cytidylyltransferase [Thermoleophilia bacterium]
MKAVILAGGFGTRISEESSVRPKPMVEVGGKPILWHIMKIYSAHGITDFVICLGYKGYVIKEFFANYFLHQADVTFDLRTNTAEYLTDSVEPWRVTLVDTGDKALTGGRLKRVAHLVGDETFCMTYGDTVGSVDVTAAIAHHRASGALVTLTATQPPGRFGAVLLEDGQDRIESFVEKPQGDGAWINGGFFVVEPAALDYIDGDETTWEREPLERLAKEGKLSAYRHRGYWQPLDTIRDKMVLEEQWQAGSPGWKVW